MYVLIVPGQDGAHQKLYIGKDRDTPRIGETVKVTSPCGKTVSFWKVVDVIRTYSQHLDHDTLRTDADFCSATVILGPL